MRSSRDGDLAHKPNSEGLQAALIGRVATFGCPFVERSGEQPPAEVPDRTWDDLLAGLVREKLTGLGVAAYQGGFLHLTDERAKGLLRRQREAMSWALGLERRLLEIADAFRAGGIEFLVLKGSAVAHTVYPDPSWRPFGDLDLLVRTRDWRRACSLLSRLGFRRKLPEPRPGFGERFANAAAHIDDGGCEVDLHRSLVIGPFGLWIDPEELFEKQGCFTLGGTPLPRLEDTALMLHACVHAALGFNPPLLLPVRDVVQVAGNLEVDWQRLADWADRWRLRAVIQHALNVAGALGLGLPEEATHLQDAPATHRERRAIGCYTTGRRRRGGIALSTLDAIPGIRSKLAYLQAILFPSRDFLTARAPNAALASVSRRWLVPLHWLENHVTHRES